MDNDKEIPGVSKLQLSQRHTLRGLRRCGTCGQINGNRAQLCRNSICPQHKNAFDVVQLESKCQAFYSLRVKEREQLRNFVCIEDVTLSLEPNAAVVSSKAVCYVDACKSDSNCRHIKACRETSTAHVSKAQVYTVSREVLSNLNISLEQKKHLWKLYKSAEEQEKMPAVQRLSATTFVVKCEPAETFPVGRLHVTALANGLSIKKGIHVCACKKLKIIVEDNSLVMQEEICDHLLLVLAGILSSPHGKTVYGNFTNSLQSFWMPVRLETPLGETTADDLCLGMSINIGDGVGDHSSDGQEDILIFGDEYFAADQLPDLDVILNVDNMLAAAPTHNNSNNNCSSPTEVRYASDAHLLSSCDIYTEPKEQMQDEATHLELTDCNIELMDQYQLTDQIDLCSDDIALPVGSEPYNILAASPIYTEATSSVANQLPPIELPTIAVVKKPPIAIKATEIVTEVKSRKQPHLPAKRALIVNCPSAATAAAAVETVGVAVEPALAYSAWLEHVIELLNELVEPADLEAAPATLVTRQVQQSFYVHKETFSHFSKSFSVGVKRRPLHQVSVIGVGKHKGLTQYVWHFGASHTAKRIFSRGNFSLQLHRAFEHRAGHFVPYVRQTVVATPSNNKRRPIYAKLKLYMVKILFSIANENKGGVRLYWTPGVLPQTNFGLMKVEFSIQIQTPS
ncbi:uncharacterized protein LOC115621240 [Scaptodrosophila lebanonensis]|uniref:Uncharacterized protein LOC115621240 n=1 Tax=Drosophila lebanonensis TaxID=7225 RepID=A0A6J2T6Y6_DROLE|nr:uncharacterized protein LOC115621240 [Scaptodrosophila lebanonensis]